MPVCNAYNGTRIVKSTSPYLGLLRDTILFGVGTNLASIAGMFLVPLYSRAFTASDFGVYGLLEVIIQILSIFFSLGFSVYYLKCFSEIKSGEDGPLLFNNILSWYLLFSLISASAVCSVVVILQSNALLSQAELYFVSVPMVFLEALNVIVVSDVRAKRKLGLFITLGISQAVFTLGSTIFFVISMHLGIMGILLGRLFANAIIAIILAFRYSRTYRFVLTPGFLRPLLKFNLPLLPASLVIIVMNGLPRYLLQYFAGTGEVGIFTMGMKVADIFRLVINTPFTLAWGYFSFQIAKRTDAKNIFAAIETYVLIIAVGAALCLICLDDILFKRFVAGDFGRSGEIFIYILLFYVLDITSYVMNVGFYLENRTDKVAIIQLISLLVNGICGIVLIPRYGALGAAVAMILGIAFRNSLFVLFSRNIFRVPFEWRRMLKISAIGICLVLVLKYVSFENIYIEAAARLMLLIFLFPAGLLFLRVFRVDEIAIVKDAWKLLRTHGWVCLFRKLNYDSH